jgi:hypothetical protein
MPGGDAFQHRASLRGVLFAALAVLVLTSLGSSAHAEETSGTVQLGNSLKYGDTSYSVDYTFPAAAQVGTNLTIDVTLHVDSLTGLLQYISAYVLSAKVFVGNQQINGSVSLTQDKNFLYPGQTWGPYNITIPLSENDTGLAKGEEANATVGIILQDSVFNGSPYNVLSTEPPMEGAAGSLLIVNPTTSALTNHSIAGQGGETYLPYFLLTGAGLVVVLAAAFWLRARKNMAT